MPAIFTFHHESNLLQLWPKPSTKIPFVKKFSTYSNACSDLSLDSREPKGFHSVLVEFKSNLANSRLILRAFLFLVFTLLSFRTFEKNLCAVKESLMYLKGGKHHFVSLSFHGEWEAVEKHVTWSPQKQPPILRERSWVTPWRKTIPNSRFLFFVTLLHVWINYFC